LLVKADRWGETQWRRSFGGSIDDNGWSLRQCADGGYVIAGMVCENTYDAYLVKTDESGLITDVEGMATTIVPVLFHLSQNQPNPFNPGTIISYELPTQAHVTLKVFDLLGREVATLVNDVEQPGFKTVTWNATGVASGVYFYRICAGSYADMKKMLLLR